ncbi:hypothetical protein ACMU_07895 [Actibacterium mucosum KCTC 23349]|uniref:HTH araC/xylS-type domain-containing protein n=1 Tax=Actibacterium mucosum KCTC 23349 TaxID=1454373 RepID=A0A037ZPT9_9RHOB|nr:AraC family transcriptional regulator [Actibacterium mucosum]KAJ56852.1 hypothetical protein ACMU_07895 [Actibacterium mucosum KCTC 23349]
MADGVSVLFYNAMVAHADPSLDKAELMAFGGLDPDTDYPPDFIVPYTTYFALLEKIAEAEKPEIRFYLRTCANFCCDHFGAVGLAWRAAPTLRKSFLRMDRHVREYNSAATFRVEEHDDGYYWVHERFSPQRTGMYLSCEGTMATYLTLAREAAGPHVQPLRLQFRHSQIASDKPLREYFGCDVVFDADYDAMVFSYDQIDAPNLKGDESMWSFFTDHLDQKMGAAGDAPLDLRVVDEVSKLLSEGPPTMEVVAANLGMGARTLQRRLSEMDTSFQSLVDQARKNVAMKFLKVPNYSLNDVAFMTGFSEQSAFSRAFKRWAGQTPGAYRAGL